MPLPFVIDNQQHRMADALNELLVQSAGRPLDSVRSVPNVDRTSVDCRNGGFCAFDDEVPPGVKFQNTP